MVANSMCISCLVTKQEKLIRKFENENKKSEYMRCLLELLGKYARTESSPALAERIHDLYQEFWGETEEYGEIKKNYNCLLLEMEAEIEKSIRRESDSLKECIKYVCAANYIDFSAVKDVNEERFRTLLEEKRRMELPEEEYAAFRAELQCAKQMVYLTDNCGEIVLDKLFIKCMKEQYPQLNITVVVRGKDVINDATMEDAKEIGLTELVTCMGNGNGAPGTVPNRISAEVKALLNEADLIISKGQGNFESLYGEGYNPYFMFLCKCELFVRRFGLKQFESVFRKEERIVLS